MLQGYFDDSGSDGQQSGFVLAGYILPSERWANFSDDWNAECLREPKIKYFKMREAAGGCGEFLSVPIEFRQYKVKNLFALIEKHKLHGIATTLQWDEFREFDSTVMTGNEAQGQPYAPLFFGTLDNVLGYQKAQGFYPHKIQLDFDNQGSAGRLAIRYYDFIMELTERFADHPLFATVSALRGIMEGTPRMLDDKDYPPLQAADMLAWPLRLRMEGDETFNRSPFAWLYEEARKTIWPGCKRFGKENWDAINGPIFNDFKDTFLKLVVPPPKS